MKTERDDVCLTALYEPGPSFSQPHRHSQSEPGQFAAVPSAAWVLIPGESARFVAVSGRYPVERILMPRPSTMRPSINDLAADTVTAHGQLCRVPSIGWEGVLYATDADAGRLGVLLRVAEGMALFFVWLRFEQERQKPIRCRCGELRQAHAKGWRFGTCEDGEPHWRCPECVKQDAEPEAR